MYKAQNLSFVVPDLTCLLPVTRMRKSTNGPPVTQTRQWDSFLRPLLGSALILLAHVVTVWKCFFFFYKNQKDIPSGLNQAVALGRQSHNLWDCREVLPDGGHSWYPFECQVPQQHLKKKKKGYLSQDLAGEVEADRHLCCVRNYQLLACKLIVKDGRPIPAVPSLTSHLIIHTDNRQSGTEGRGVWLTHWVWTRTIYNFGETKTHTRKTTSESSTLQRGVRGINTPTSVTMSQVGYIRSNMLLWLFTETERRVLTPLFFPSFHP